MNRFANLAVGAAALAAAAAPAAAAGGLYTDELSKCLVARSNADDKSLLVQWIFGAMSTHPAVKGLGEVGDARRSELAASAARLFGRLMLEDCRPEMVAAIRYDGVGAIEKSFGVLGEVAMTDLMAHPSISRELDAMAARIDQSRLQELMREAGAPAAPKKPGAR